MFCSITVMLLSIEFYGSQANYLLFEKNLTSTTNRIDVAFFLLKLEGMLFYSFLTGESSHFEYIFVEIKNENFNIIYNGRRNSLKLLSFCRCDSCLKEALIVSISISAKEISVLCNGHSPPTFDRKPLSSTVFKNFLYPVPQKWNEFLKMFVWIGNVGPYRGLGNLTWLPLEEQLNACILNVTMNGQQRSPSNNFSRCSRNICNTGACAMVSSHKYCNILDPPDEFFCPESYTKKSSEEYVLITFNKPQLQQWDAILKISWQQTEFASYNLIQIMLRDGTLSVDVDSHYKLRISYKGKTAVMDDVVLTNKKHVIIILFKQHFYYKFGSSLWTNSTWPMNTSDISKATIDTDTIKTCQNKNFSGRISISSKILRKPTDVTMGDDAILNTTVLKKDIEICTVLGDAVLFKTKLALIAVSLLLLSVLIGVSVFVCKTCNATNRGTDSNSNSENSQNSNNNLEMNVYQRSSKDDYDVIGDPYVLELPPQLPQTEDL